MIFNATLADLSHQLATKALSSQELVQCYLKRIDSLNPKLNAIVTLDRDRTLAEAVNADYRRQRGEAGPLTGIPLVHKDIFCQQGWKTSCGSRMLDNFISPYNAHVVEQCQAAGMVTLGRANMDEFAMGSTNEHSWYGAVRNPWDLQAVPGGSSGGSAASVAARMAPVATATDTGGSIRQPAAHCGVTGIKPTYGLVSRYGMVAFASSLDQGGVIAQTAEDCAMMLNVIAGFDTRDATSIQRAHEDYTRDLHLPLAGLKIGLPSEYFAEGLSEQVACAIESAIGELKALGADIVAITLPNTKLSIPAYYVIASAEASSNLSRYDGVRYGYRAPEYKDLIDMYEKTRAEGFGCEVKRRIMVGTYVLSHGYYDAYYLKAQKIRRLIATDFVEAFTQCDVILGPVAPTVAFNIGEKSSLPVQMYLSDIYTLAVNLAGLPGVSVPVGFADNGRPIGLQIIGNYFSEAKMLNVAHQFQQVTDWHSRAPSL